MKKPSLDHYRNPRILEDLDASVESLPEHLRERGVNLIDDYRSLTDQAFANQHVAGRIIEDVIGLLLLANYASTACDLAVEFACTYKTRLRGAQVPLSRWSAWVESVPSY